MHKILLALALPLAAFSLSAQPAKLTTKTHQMAKEVEPKVIEWRHDIHQYPELSNREFKTAEKVAAHLTSLGIAVETGVAKTGVIGILKGSKPGPTIALRADMDALPVTERVVLPWASKEVSSYNGIETGVMHACGHDTHVAILMGVAEVLSKVRNELKGTIIFVFQPAEEGPPVGEEGGAKLMVAEGVLKRHKVEVIFGLHINSQTPVGTIKYKPGGLLAAADMFTINVKGKQTHGSQPWAGIDPIVASAQIINGIQAIVSRQTELTKEAAVISVGLIRGGIRNNIIPESVEMIGTIRTLDVAMQDKLHADLRRTATKIGESMNAEVTLEIIKNVPVTFNHLALTSKVAPWLASAAGADRVEIQNAITGAEDFAFFANEIPGFFFFVGGCAPGADPKLAAPHHTPDFQVDDAGMLTGMKAMLSLTLGYMHDPMK